MTIPIVIYGSPVLMGKSFDIDKPDDIDSLAENMIQTMKKAAGNSPRSRTPVRRS
jgi:peptide deformylase